MNKTIEKFYLSILDYAGLKYEDNIIKNKNEKLGDFTIDDRYITLPYMENLKNPNGRVIFHLLNENYVNPETTLFNLYRKRLVAEINLKLLNLFSTIIEIISEVNIVKKIKDNKLLQLFSNYPEVDLSSLEALLSLAKRSKEINDEAFLLNIYLKKNGTFKENNYDAIGKINFIVYKEILKVLENKELKLYEGKFRKKDLNLFSILFLTIFPKIDDEDFYTEYTNNKVFRYLDILLKTSYLVTKPINDVSSMIINIEEYKERKDDLVFNLEWVSDLEKVYDLKEEIRLIPNQVDITLESNRINIETKNKSVFEKDEPKTTINFNQPRESIQQNSVSVNTPRPVTPEDVLRGNVNTNFVQPVTPMQPMLQPMLQPQLPMPSWMIKEIMQQNINTNAMQMPMQQTPMQSMMPQMPVQQMPMQPAMQPGYPMQQMPMQPMMQPGYPMQSMMPQMPMNQMPMQPMMQPNYPTQQNTSVSSLEVNPQMFRR